jgi:hypothetical protein
VLTVPPSIRPYMHAMQPALAASIAYALHAVLVAVGCVHAVRNAEICAALQALAIRTTGT